MPSNTFHGVLKTLIFAGFAYLFFLILKPFLAAIILALALSMVFYPLVQKLKQKWSWGDTLAALFTTILTLLFIILPILLLIGLLTQQAVLFLSGLDLQALSLNVEKSLAFAHDWQIAGYTLDVMSLKEKLVASLGVISGYVSTGGLRVISTLSQSFFLFFVFILLYFYFLRDAKMLLSGLQKLLPYTKSQQKILFQSFRDVSRTLFYGNTFLALVAGLVAYVGFLIFGFKGALIWALLAFIFSFIPTVGTLLIYVAGMIIVAFTQSFWLCLLMLIYYILIELVGRETLLQGWVLEDKLKLHPILVFFALVGGVSAFGSLGLIYGPLTIVFLGAFYRFYSQEKSPDVGKKKA